MTEDDYEAKVAEYEAKYAKWLDDMERLDLAERALVAQSHDDEAFLRHDLLVRYDAALLARDKAGIAAYMVAVEELRIKSIDRKAALAAVRAEFGALKPPGRPRRTWGQLFGFK
jgi:hypothetical protein